MGKYRDRSGERVGRLTIIQRANDYVDANGNRRTMWECICDCGNVVTVRADCLNTNHTTSCGCLQKDRVREMMKSRTPANKKHGEGRNRLHNIWYLMCHRCERPSSPAYKNYGGRGIKVCDKWSNKDTGFLEFKSWAMENGYGDDLTLDRIDNNKNYSPDNCRWIPICNQASNKRNNKLLEFDGRVQTLSQWAREVNIPMKTLHKRISSGWSIERALTQKLRHY